MEAVHCCSCHKTKAPLVCGICESAICKSCMQWADVESFALLSQVPDEWTRGPYCPTCFETHVAAGLADYENTVAQAREILVFNKKQSKETRLISRKEPRISVADCADEDEAIVRLAFMAVKKGFNAVIDIGTSWEKVRNGGYQTLKWEASGIPANVNDSKLLKDRSLWQNPN